MQEVYKKDGTVVHLLDSTFYKEVYLGITNSLVKGTAYKLKIDNLSFVFIDITALTQIPKWSQIVYGLNNINQEFDLMDVNNMYRFQYHKNGFIQNAMDIPENTRIVINFYIKE